MDPLVIIAVLSIIAVSGFVQGLAGFGSALVAVPLLSLFMDPLLVVPLALVHGLVMNTYLSARNRKEIVWRTVLPLLISGIIGIPIGAALLLLFPSSALKIMMGMVISLFSLFLLGGFRFGPARGDGAIIPTGLLSGILNGSVAMSGPPVILLFSNQEKRKGPFKANLVAYFMLLNIVTFLVFSLSGILTTEILILSALLLPPLAVGILAGELVSSMVGEGAFRKVALLLVLAAGSISLTSGLLAIAG